MTPFIFIGYTLYFKRVRPLYMDLREKMSNLNTFSQENIEGNRVVKAFAREGLRKPKDGRENGEFKEANTGHPLSGSNFSLSLRDCLRL